MIRALLVVCALLLCISSAAAQEPEWLTAARAREGRDLKPQPIRSKDGRFTATVVGTVAEDGIEIDGDSYTITIGIGADTPVVCEILGDDFEMAGLLSDAADVTIEEFTRGAGKVEGRALERTDAGAYGAHPFLALDWVFRVNDGREVRAGALKQVAIVRGSQGIYCAHLEFGFTRTFETVARSLVESLRFAQEEAVPYFTEISTVRLQDRKIGIAMLTMKRDEEGDTLAAIRTALVVPLAPQGLQVEDERSVQWIRPDGTLISAGLLVVTGDGLETLLELRPGPEGKWVVEGAFERRELTRTLDAPPITIIQEARERRGLFGRKDVAGTRMTNSLWTTADPTRLVPQETTVLSVVDEDHISARETIGGTSAEIVVERSTGLPSKQAVELGPGTLRIERVFVQGSF